MLFKQIWANKRSPASVCVTFVLSPPAKRFIISFCVFGFSNTFTVLVGTCKRSRLSLAALFGLSTKASIAFYVALVAGAAAVTGAGVGAFGAAAFIAVGCPLLVPTYSRALSLAIPVCFVKSWAAACHSPILRRARVLSTPAASCVNAWRL